MGIYFNPSMIASEKTEIIRYMLIKQSCLITQMNGLVHQETALLSVMPAGLANHTRQV